MHIVQIANFVTSTSGGLKRCLSELRSRYLENGHEVTLVIPSNKNFTSRENGVNIIHYRGLPLVGSGGYRVILRRNPLMELINEIHPDIVEVSDKTTLAWLPNYLRSMGIPSVVISHERTDLAMKRNLPSWMPAQSLSNSWNASLARGASVVVCASQFAASEFEGSNVDIRLIPLGVDTDTFSPILRESNHPPIKMVYCGRFSPEKNPTVVIEALRILHTRGVSALLTMIGSGPLEKDLQELGQGLPISFLGYRSSRTEIAQLLARADVGVYMGGVETFGLAVLETLACGTPVVVSQDGAGKELLTSNVGVAVDDDPAAVADAVLDLAQNDSFADISVECREHAVQFTWDKTAAAMLNIFEELTRDALIERRAS